MVTNVTSCVDVEISTSTYAPGTGKTAAADDVVTVPAIADVTADDADVTADADVAVGGSGSATVKRFVPQSLALFVLYSRTAPSSPARQITPFAPSPDNKHNNRTNNRKDHVMQKLQ